MSENNKDAKPWDILNPKTVFLNDEDSNFRFDICKTCPDLIKFTSQCKKCGCFMKIKVKLENASCPIGKW
jgi:hypothetical protein